MSLLEDIRDFMITCPNLDSNALVNIYKTVKDKENYSIDPIENERIIFENVLGQKTLEFRFYFTITKSCDTTQKELNTQTLLESIVDWIEQQENIKNYPTSNGIKLAVETNPELYSKDESFTIGVYQILITYQYKEN